MANFYYADVEVFKEISSNLGIWNKTTFSRKAGYSKGSYVNVERGERVTSATAIKTFNTLVILELKKPNSFKNCFPICSNTHLGNGIKIDETFETTDDDAKAKQTLAEKALEEEKNNK